MSFMVQWFLTEQLSLTPLQFRAQHIEECAVDAQQLDLVLGLAAMHTVSVVHWHTDLAVDAEVSLVLRRY